MERQLTNREWCLSPDELKFVPVSKQETATLNGEYTLAQVSVFEEAFKNNIIAGKKNNPIVEAIKVHGESFYTNLNTINNVVLKSDFVVGIIPNYELLEQRMLAGPITPIEFAQFISEYSYTPISANFSASQNSPRFLKQLDDFYRGSFADSVMGGFCALMPSAFLAVGGFFALIGKVGGLIQDALSFISKIKNIEDPIKALFEAIKVKALIEAIKEKISKAVMGAINKIKDAIENFDIANVVAGVENFVTNTIGKRVSELKEEISTMFSKENLEKIEAKIKGMIDFAVGLFANPSLEEIMFLMARICGFAAGVEAIISGVKAPLDSITDRYTNTFNALRSASDRNTAEVIDAGGIRMSDEHRREQINISREAWVAAGNQSPVTEEERSAVPTWEQIRNNTHGTIRIQGRWVSILGAAGWTGVSIDVRVLLMRLQKEFDKGPLIVNSGWRSQAYQNMLIREGRTTAVNSLHIQGMALDITWNGRGNNLTYEAEFVEIAKTLGFKGIGYYNSFTHIDIGPTRYWRG